MIYIKTLYGETLVLNVDTTNTVLSLKEMILEKLENKIDISNQKLIYNGKLLKNENKMLEFDIIQESPLLLMDSSVKIFSKSWKFSFCNFDIKKH